MSVTPTELTVKARNFLTGMQSERSTPNGSQSGAVGSRSANALALPRAEHSRSFKRRPLRRPNILARNLADPWADPISVGYSSANVNRSSSEQKRRIVSFNSPSQENCRATVQSSTNERGEGKGNSPAQSSISLLSVMPPSTAYVATPLPTTVSLEQPTATAKLDPAPHSLIAARLRQTARKSTGGRRNRCLRVKQFRIDLDRLVLGIYMTKEVSFVQGSEIPSIPSIPGRHRKRPSGNARSNQKKKAKKELECEETVSSDDDSWDEDSGGCARSLTVEGSKQFTLPHYTDDTCARARKITKSRTAKAKVQSYVELSDEQLSDASHLHIEEHGFSTGLQAVADAYADSETNDSDGTDDDASYVPISSEGECNSPELSRERMMSPVDDEYNMRLWETISKLSGDGFDVPLEVSTIHSKRESERSEMSTERAASLPVHIDLSQLHPALPDPSSCTSAVTGTESASSKAVQVESGVVVDQEVLDSYLAVKMKEQLFQMKGKLLATENQVRKVMEEKKKLEDKLNEKMTVIRDLTRTGLRPRNQPSMQDCSGVRPQVRNTSRKLVNKATQTASTFFHSQNLFDRRFGRFSARQSQDTCAVADAIEAQATCIVKEVNKEQPQNTSAVEGKMEEKPQDTHTADETMEEQPQDTCTAEEIIEEQPQDTCSVEETGEDLPQDTCTVEEIGEVQPQDTCTVEETVDEQGSRNVDAECKQDWLFDATNRSSSRCYAFRPQARFLRNLNIDNPKGRSGNQTLAEYGWDSLGPVLNEMLLVIKKTYSVLSKITTRETFVVPQVVNLVTRLEHLLAHIPFPKSANTTPEESSLADYDGSDFLFQLHVKLTELLEHLRRVRKEGKSVLPKYFRIEMKQVENIVLQVRNTVKNDMALRTGGPTTQPVGQDLAPVAEPQTGQTLPKRSQPLQLLRQITLYLGKKVDEMSSCVQNRDTALPPLVEPTVDSEDLTLDERVTQVVEKLGNVSSALGLPNETTSALQRVVVNLKGHATQAKASEDRQPGPGLPNEQEPSSVAPVPILPSTFATTCSPSILVQSSPALVSVSTSQGQFVIRPNSTLNVSALHKAEKPIARSVAIPPYARRYTNPPLRRFAAFTQGVSTLTTPALSSLNAKLPIWPQSRAQVIQMPHRLQVIHARTHVHAQVPPPSEHVISTVLNPQTFTTPSRIGLSLRESLASNVLSHVSTLSQPSTLPQSSSTASPQILSPSLTLSKSTTPLLATYLTSTTTTSTSSLTSTVSVSTSPLTSTVSVSTSPLTSTVSVSTSPVTSTTASVSTTSQTAASSMASLTCGLLSASTLTSAVLSAFPVSSAALISAPSLTSTSTSEPSSGFSEVSTTSALSQVSALTHTSSALQVSTPSITSTAPLNQNSTPPLSSNHNCTPSVTFTSHQDSTTSLTSTASYQHSTSATSIIPHQDSTACLSSTTSPHKSTAGLTSTISPHKYTAGLTSTTSPHNSTTCLTSTTSPHKSTACITSTTSPNKSTACITSTTSPQISTSSLTSTATSLPLMATSTQTFKATTFSRMSAPHSSHSASTKASLPSHLIPRFSCPSTTSAGTLPPIKIAVPASKPFQAPTTTGATMDKIGTPPTNKKVVTTNETVSPPTKKEVATSIETVAPPTIKVVASTNTMVAPPSDKMMAPPNKVIMTPHEIVMATKNVMPPVTVSSSVLTSTPSVSVVVVPPEQPAVNVKTSTKPPMGTPTNPGPASSNSHSADPVNLIVASQASTATGGRPAEQLQDSTEAASSGVSRIGPKLKVQVKCIQQLDRTQAIVIKWSFSDEEMHFQGLVQLYELYAVIVRDSSAKNWGKVGTLVPLPLPMAATLTSVVEGQVYVFAVKAIFRNGTSTFTESHPIMLHSRI